MLLYSLILLISMSEFYPDSHSDTEAEAEVLVKCKCQCKKTSCKACFPPNK